MKSWMGIGVALSEVVFPMASILLGVYYNSPTFVVASLLIFIFLFTVAYAALWSEKTPIPFRFLPLYPFVHNVGIGLLLLTAPNLERLPLILTVASFVANYVIAMPLIVLAWRKVEEDKTAEFVWRFVFALSGLAVIAVALQQGLTIIAVIALVAITFAIPHIPPERERGNEVEGS